MSVTSNLLKSWKLVHAHLIEDRHFVELPLEIFDRREIHVRVAVMVFAPAMYNLR
jgi:hypothetical protein